MYILKQIPEDFIVKEHSKIVISEGPYHYFEIKKINLTTNKTIEIIAEKIHILKKNINYAGNKDKNAVTTQTISIKSNKDLSKVKIEEENISLNYLGSGEQPINLGDLENNNFILTIRNITNIPKLQEYFPNYFDSQRFSKNNSEIGKLLIKKDFKKATELLRENNHPNFQRSIAKNPSNYVGAINKIPRKILMIYLHSYQSYLFNKLLNQHIKDNYTYTTKNFDFGEISFTDKQDNKEFPLIGFDTIPNKEVLKILKEENLTLRDFIIRQLPNLSLEGTTRKAFVKTENISISELQEDELNKNKKKCTLSFTLPAGSYATMFVKAIFNKL